MSQVAADRAYVLSCFAAGKSLWRSYMNEQVRRLGVVPPVLDLGAGRLGSSSYHEAMPVLRESGVVSVDLDGAKRPTVRADVQGALPFRTASFGTCLAFNLLEHLFDPASLLADAARVLVPGGTVLVGVPFLGRVHGDPSDYFRYTRFALERMMTDAGLVAELTVPCGAGALTAALSQVDFLVPRRLRRVACRVAWAADLRITKRSGGRYRNEHDYPLGYVVVARRAK